MPWKHISLLLLCTTVACGRPSFALIPTADSPSAQTGEAVGSKEPVVVETEDGASDPTQPNVEEGISSPIPADPNNDQPVPGDVSGPSIVSKFPADGAGEQPSALTIAVTLNEPIDAATFSSTVFTLSRGNEEIAAVAGYDSSTRTVTLRPAGRLVGGESYKITLSKAIRDLSGNPLPNDEVWNFTVAPTGWTWISGSDVVGQANVHGTKGVANSANTPGGRQAAMTSFDANGNLQVFGGAFTAGGGGLEYNNDVWSFNGSQWTWLAGDNTTNRAGVYGTLGTAAAANSPGSRCCGIAVRKGNNLLVFGGNAFDGNGVKRYGNDLWSFDGKQWTWLSGSTIGNQQGVYGTKGTAAPGNHPGGRQLTAGGTDRDGNVLIFGGHAYTETGVGNSNDLWKWDGSQWTWMSGAKTSGEGGVYGTKGVAAANNTPGARNGAMSWTDRNGDFYIFGGIGVDSTGTTGDLNDLWKWNGSQWTWVSGSNLANQSGIYGTKGVAANANVPGGRAYGSAAMDSLGHIWLFGGKGRDTIGTQSRLNDLWRWDGLRWTWMQGSNLVDGTPNYGTKGSRDSDNVPGARFVSAIAIDAFDNIWLFGGTGRDRNGANSDLNDLWRYTP